MKKEGKTKPKLWFRLRVRGFGWTPCSMKGWLVLVIYIVCLIMILLMGDLYFSSGNKVERIIIPFIVLTISLVVIIMKKGERIVWGMKEYGNRR